DFSVENKEVVPSILGLNERYYSKDIGKLKIVVLDGQEISLFAYSDANHPNRAKAENYLDSINRSKETWNGGMSSKQLLWLSNILEESNKKVLIVSHYPVYPLGGIHNLWNDEELYTIIEN